VNNNPFSVYMLRDSGIDWGQVRQDDSYKPAGKNTGLQEHGEWNRKIIRL